MRSFILYVFIVLSAVCMPVANNIAVAAVQEKPLMVIRFNSNIIDYEKSLDKAVKKALQTKPTTFFDLIAISPETTDGNKNKQFEKEIKILAEKVKDRVIGAGAPVDMVRITLQKNKLIKSNEIQIFVQ